MVKKTAYILLSAIILQAAIIPSASATEHLPAIAAVSALLIEKDNGTVLYEQNSGSRHPADRLSVIMTIMLASHAVENDEINDNEYIEMSESALDNTEDSGVANTISAGEIMTFIDLMYSAYLGGITEACNMIAITLSGSTDAFVRRMNDKAAELGCTDTNFTNPSGIYHSNQYTSANDMYLIYSEALKSTLFNEISGTYRHVTEQTEDTQSRTLVSSNSLLNQNSIYYYRYCLSGIGSSTFEGGFSLVASAEENGLNLISIILGAREVINDDESVNLRHFTETARLFTWGYNNYSWREILRTTDLITKVPVLHGSGADFINVRPERPLVLLLSNSVSLESFKQDIVIYSERYGEPLTAPVSAGDKLGELKISLNGVTLDTIALIANTDIELNGFEYMRRQIADALATPAARYIIIALVVIILAYIALVVRYNVKRIQRLKKIKEARTELIRERREQTDRF